eukprot:CAMPEP_0198317214 /NCGR_PEP_ID=MMETSP1450-20131203/6770_1 /TAXON_ID=753684 ORGANISM="Madagascaria erythrocladiodes, Strain CCMP3234" /NCGR_SAMPLE_ID=MMETSP1450 /ASSEMBLY_ACC=CAM_ASM_001115 /LENGTH=305 /DNA_ID=CAMNT_0044020403 /DNA_START=62 /DNA_END=979 /DNA_ORIENTATION=-
MALAGISFTVTAAITLALEGVNFFLTLIALWELLDRVSHTATRRSLEVLQVLFVFAAMLVLTKFALDEESFRAGNRLFQATVLVSVAFQGFWNEISCLLEDLVPTNTWKRRIYRSNQVVVGLASSIAILVLMIIFWVIEGRQNQVEPREGLGALILSTVIYMVSALGVLALTLCPYSLIFRKGIRRAKIGITVFMVVVILLQIGLMLGTALLLEKRGIAVFQEDTIAILSDTLIASFAVVNFTGAFSAQKLLRHQLYYTNDGGAAETDSSEGSFDDLKKPSTQSPYFSSEQDSAAFPYFIAASVV